MICNRCVKQEVCKYKFDTEGLEQAVSKDYDKKFGHIELDCKLREPATEAQMQKIKQRAEYAPQSE